MQGQAVDIRIHAEEMRRMANRLYEIYSKHTGQPADVIGTSLARALCKAANNFIDTAYG